MSIYCHQESFPEGSATLLELILLQVYRSDLLSVSVTFHWSQGATSSSNGSVSIFSIKINDFQPMNRLGRLKSREVLQPA